MTGADLVPLVLAELAHAQQKFPAGFHSGHEGYAVIREELDELWDAVKCDDLAAACAEAVQVAAMALRFIVELAEQAPAVRPKSYDQRAETLR